MSLTNKTISTEMEKEKVEKLQTSIRNLKEEDNFRDCEELIRLFFEKISGITDQNKKEDLLAELKSASCCGLCGKLKKLVKDNGLTMEALDLVLKYRNTREDLAKFFYDEKKSDNTDPGFVALRSRLGPNLEVLGGLLHEGINDVTKEWVKRLVEEAPSFRALSRMSVHDVEIVCKEASRGEKEIVNIVVRTAHGRTKQEANPQDVEEIVAKEKLEKVFHQENLKKATALLNEAKELVKQQSEEANKAANEKVAEISKIIQLPPDWNKQDNGLEPEKLLEKLEGIIEQLESVVEVGEAYTSDVEVVRKASGGRALCGIHHSEHNPPTTAELPIIVMPMELNLASPHKSVLVDYMKFSQSRAAANYIEAVKSSSWNIGRGIKGFYGLLAGDGNINDFFRCNEEETKSSKKHTKNASVVKYSWIATKTFKIEGQQLELTGNAKKMARAINDEKTARVFMQRFGSHFPAGLQTLGGVFFHIVDAESSCAMAASVLTEKAIEQLQNQISFGVLSGLSGAGASISGERSNSNGKTEGHEEKADQVLYTFSFQAMGPPATNPAAFRKLLANSSTWALIDRGNPNAYIPVWELIRDLGADFEDAAKTLELAWCKGEEEKKQKRDNDIEELRSKFDKDMKELRSKFDKDMKKLRSKILQGGEYILKIEHFIQKLSEAKDKNKSGQVEGDPFFTSPFGYKVKLLVILNEMRKEFKNNMSVYLVIMKSERDAILPWPFKKKVSFTLIDQEQDESIRKNIEHTFTPNGSDRYQKPQSEENKGWGYTSFVSHEKLLTSKYIVDDTVFVKVKVEQ